MQIFGFRSGFSFVSGISASDSALKERLSQAGESMHRLDVSVTYGQGAVLAK